MSDTQPPTEGTPEPEQTTDEQTTDEQRTPRPDLSQGAGHATTDGAGSPGYYKTAPMEEVRAELARRGIRVRRFGR